MRIQFQFPCQIHASEFLKSHDEVLLDTRPRLIEKSVGELQELQFYSFFEPAMYTRLSSHTFRMMAGRYGGHMGLADAKTLLAHPESIPRGICAESYYDPVYIIFLGTIVRRHTGEIVVPSLRLWFTDEDDEVGELKLSVMTPLKSVGDANHYVPSLLPTGVRDRARAVPYDQEHLRPSALQGS